MEKACTLSGHFVTVIDSELINELEKKYSYGWIDPENNFKLSLCEAYYLFDKKNLIILDQNNTQLNKENLRKYAESVEEDFNLKFHIYNDLRTRGYVVKTGLKYGTHFRVYERGVKPQKGQRSKSEHAKFLVHALSESYQCGIPEIARLVRLSHSVRKKIWLGVLDSEGDVTYYQIMRVTP